VGQILGGAVSYGFQNLGGGVAIAGWRVMFLVLGGVTVVFGVATWVWMPDNPMEVKGWLSEREKVALLKHVSVNLTGVENRKIRLGEIWEALRDVQVWLIWGSIYLVGFTS
jgi:MFS family permease